MENSCFFIVLVDDPPHDKTNKMTVRPAKTKPIAQWVAKDPIFFERTAKTLIRLGGCPG